MTIEAGVQLQSHILPIIDTFLLRPCPEYSLNCHFETLNLDFTLKLCAYTLPLVVAGGKTFKNVFFKTDLTIIKIIQN